MTIEQEIRQKSFASPFHKMVVNLYFTANWLKNKELSVFKKFGISAQQFNVLRILKGQHPNPCTLLNIKERMLDKDSNTSRLVDKLVASGLVERKECPEDRRQVDILITHKGIELLGKINPEVNDVHKFSIGLTETEALLLSDFLDKLRERKS
ncbi:MAG: MarR family transcriptional regulator [Cyclobacteriaceae bacterium]|nr:MarR family transcriptional regulator [Cyclobacteriaceae bacterium]